MNTPAFHLNSLPVFVSAEDWHSIKDHSWHLFKTGRKNNPRFVVATRIGGKRVKLHRFLTSAPAGMSVDHINNNPLDNRRENLRVCSQGENAMNQSKRANPCSSRFKGVSKTKFGKWMAYINVHRARTVLGYFTDEKQAAFAYDRAALEKHGPFARLNFQTPKLIAA